MPAYQLHTKSEIHYTGFTLLCQGVNCIFLKFPYLDFILTYDKMNIECPAAMFLLRQHYTFHKNGGTFSMNTIKKFIHYYGPYKAVFLLT